jgi:RHS repeat-associated protein
VENSGQGNLSHSPIQFNYDTTSNSITKNQVTTSLNVSNIEQRNALSKSLDLTGNGNLDFIIEPKENRNKFWVFKDVTAGNANTGVQVNTGGDYEDVLVTSLLNSQNKVFPGQGLTVIQNEGNAFNVEFKVYSNGSSNTLAWQYTKDWSAPYVTVSGSQVRSPLEYLSGDFNGDGLTDVVAITKRDGLVSSSNFKRAYFLDLKRGLNTNWSNYAGQIFQEVDDNDVLRTGDFNGDGKTDIIHVSSSNFRVYTINDSNQITLLWQTNDSDINPVQPLFLGDFNGDGKTDILDPEAVGSTSFNLFTSKGTSFRKKTRDQSFEFQNTINEGGGVLNGFNLIPVDINGDGKTDIVEYNTTTTDGSTTGSQTVRAHLNRGFVGNANVDQIRFTQSGSETSSGNLRHFPIPIFLTNQANKGLDFASISDRYVTNFTFNKDHREDVLIRSIVNNGVTQEIDYSILDESKLNEDGMQIYHPLPYSEIYPNVDLVSAQGTKVVSTLKRIVAGTETLKQLFAYQGAVYNVQGLGFLGFNGTVRSNWHTNISDRIFTTTKYDIDLRGVVISQFSRRFDFTFTQPTSSSTFISLSTFQHNYSISPSKVFKTWMTSSFLDDQLNDTYRNSTYVYNSNNNPLSIQSIYNGGNTVETLSYLTPGGSGHVIDQVGTRTSVSTIGSETFQTDEQYIYNSGNLIINKRVKGNNTAFDDEFYDYDQFGNVTSKRVVPNGSSPREVKFYYDSTGRFLEKSIDIHGMQTELSYNTAKGILTKSLNPYGQLTRYDYDDWYRPIVEQNYLGKSSYTTYLENPDFSYEVIQTADDGSESKVYFDQLGRTIKVDEKDVKGNVISKSFVYDKFDRVSKVSEPYSGFSPSQWNETIYDSYGRTETQILYTGKTIDINYNGLSVTVSDGTQTVTSVSDGMGNTQSVTDMGGTINYTYYGNGNLKEAEHSGSLVSIEQDGWGRKTKLIDPSAGVFEYSYTGYGEIASETSPKGLSTYNYSADGKLISKEVVGDHVDMAMSYSYHPINQFISQISTTNVDGNNSTLIYQYDNDSRLTSIKENNNLAEFEESYTYDSFGRMSTETYDAKLLSNNFTSAKTIQNSYSNGILEKILDDDTGNSIWEVGSINARGQIGKAFLGNGLVTKYDYDIYGYQKLNEVTTNNDDVLMELRTSFDAQRGTLSDRMNSLFSWSETFGYDDLDRLVTFNDNNGVNELTYDSSGRILENNAVGGYNYSSSSYKVDSIDLNNQGDLYYQQNPLQQISFNAFNKPVEITEQDQDKVSFQYNPFLRRSHMFYDGLEDDIYQRNKRKHYSFNGSMEIAYDAEENKTKFTTYIGGNATNAVAIWTQEQTTSSPNNGYYYFHRDYLGSILMITDESGDIKEKRHFDAWGEIVKLTDGSGNTLDKFQYSDRGYTGHEHLQSVNLIHMNARLYDPHLKRFLSPDNYIQDISNSQNFNRYSYVWNNPLMYTDPSGNMIEGGGGGIEIPFGGSIGTIVMGTVGYYSFLYENRQAIGNWVETNAQSAYDDVVDFFGDLFGPRHKGPTSESYNTNTLTSDPLAGSSMAMPESSFAGGGGSIGGLGISGNGGESWLTQQAGRALMFQSGFRNGFIAGAESSWNFITSLGTAKGWQDLGQGLKSIAILGSPLMSGEQVVMRAQIAQSSSNFIERIPSMSAYEAGYHTGFVTEKVAESVLLSKGAGISANFARGLIKGSTSTASLVQKSAVLAERAIGGTGRFAGTAKHTYANNLLRRYQGIYGNRGLEFNSYFNNGVGNRGFLDVINHQTKTIYDFKFGKANWRTGQFEKYQRNFPGYSIEIVRPY